MKRRGFCTGIAGLLLTACGNSASRSGAPLATVGVPSTNTPTPSPSPTSAPTNTPSADVIATVVEQTVRTRVAQIASSTPAAAITATPLGVTPTPVQPTSTATPAPNVLYQADWSNGLNGWPGGAWKTVGKMLINDGSDGTRWTFSPAPFQLNGTMNYAVETEIQVVHRDGQGFGVVARANNGNGYWFGVDGGSIDPLIYSVSGGGSTYLGAGPRLSDELILKYNVYRAEVQDNSLRFFVNGGLVFSKQDNRFLMPGRTGLWCSASQINVRSFKVIAL